MQKPAEDVAISILGWLASEPELLGRFMALSGVDASSMRNAVNDPGFLAGLVDFLMNHEPTLVAFCEATDTPPETVVRAHHTLSGPADYE
ncbi:DUF3572 domain-containing protein [Rhizobium sp. CFBP 8762]|uniref:DUF3572 domain-containing protein n=1 Tax=Rhizobium sp. CFBP 8762 TaxID=2775279 RepID=UPI00177B4A74|nr:DUF3572 domain-containing protein [Rhizobium sp. CFBP 8762]MBD8552936.1 DUF3572 domain-containing protein [Rhizobium sp. CFBP 8762]